MRLRVQEMLNSQRCIIKEDGQLVYDAIHDPLKAGETVFLDFAGSTQYASPFFNFAIGQLLKDIKEGDLRRLLHIENIGEAGKLVVERVIENASRYHTDIDYRKIVDAILEQQARESA